MDRETAELVVFAGAALLGFGMVLAAAYGYTEHQASGYVASFVIGVVGVVLALVTSDALKDLPIISNETSPPATTPLQAIEAAATYPWNQINRRLGEGFTDRGFLAGVIAGVLFVAGRWVYRRQ